MKNSITYLIVGLVCWVIGMIVLLTDGSDVTWGVSLVMSAIYLSTSSILKTIEDKDETI